MTDTDQVHRRFDPLLGEWVLVSPHRGRRPWQGQIEETAPAREAFDSTCYLCPGNARAGGERNPDYSGVHVFDNDFPALLGRSGDGDADAGFGVETGAAEPPGSLLRSEAVAGACRVMCFSPRHDLSMGELDDAGRERVIETWIRETRDLGEHWAWVQCFENRGAMMGCSSPHPHGQIWALDRVPTLVQRESDRQLQHHAEHGTALLMDTLLEELAAEERIVVANDHWVALVPYWARWPFETLLLPRRPVATLPELGADERSALAAVLGELMCAYDNLFACDFPYSFGWHGAPSTLTAAQRDAWVLHAHCYPPLLRSATVRKFMVGFEMLAEAQRDLTAEQAAARLREACGPHFRHVAAQQ